MAVILSDSNAWAGWSGKRPEVFRRWSEITTARLSRPGIFTWWLSWSLGGNPSTCGKTRVCHAGLMECFQARVMLWDRTWEGFGSINSLKQKTAKPETSRLLVSSQMQIHTWTDGNTRGLGRWRETWWNTWCLRDWGCVFTGPQTPLFPCALPLCRVHAGEESSLHKTNY